MSSEYVKGRSSDDRPWTAICLLVGIAATLPTWVGWVVLAWIAWQVWQL